ncbi:MAG TPA: hypothetical protein VLJ17_24570 [Xanthobacteraceae bacterium]|nr:hypothetical protein [Xanthobacteraceae bacterium]
MTTEQAIVTHDDVTRKMADNLTDPTRRGHVPPISTAPATSVATKPILLVDFDGVIHSYKTRWLGARVIPDPPVPGALEWLDNATNYFDVQIYSSRSHDPAGVQAMCSWIVAYAVHVFGSSAKAIDLINKLKFPTTKPPAFLTIDDRALTFEGTWDRFDPQLLLQFQPWYKRKKEMTDDKPV